jgi:HSP20 family protein
VLPGGSEDWNIAMNFIQKPDEVIIKASLPGVKAGDINVAIAENVPTIKVERKAEDTGKDAVYLVRERPTGSFFRARRLPDIINTEKIRSTYENGVLTLDNA